MSATTCVMRPSHNGPCIDSVLYFRIFRIFCIGSPNVTFNWCETAVKNYRSACIANIWMLTSVNICYSSLSLTTYFAKDLDLRWNGTLENWNFSEIHEFSKIEKRITIFKHSLIMYVGFYCLNCSKKLDFPTIFLGFKCYESIFILSFRWQRAVYLWGLFWLKFCQAFACNHADSRFTYVSIQQ